MTPTSDAIRAKATELFMETLPSELVPNTPEDSELKESGLWEEAKRILMSGGEVEAEITEIGRLHQEIQRLERELARSENAERMRKLEQELAKIKKQRDEALATLAQKQPQFDASQLRSMIEGTLRSMQIRIAEPSPTPQKIEPNVLAKFLDRLYPPYEQIVRGQATDNAIIQHSVFVLGGPGEGKTATAQFLVQEAKRRYGPDKVHDHWVTGENLREALDEGWGYGKPIQIKVVEDLTNVTFKDRNGEVRDLFRIRDRMIQLAGVNEGLCVLLATGHRFFDVHVAFRSDCDFYLVKSVPSNKYDYDFLKNLIGQEGIEQLRESENRRLTEPQRKGDCFITHKMERLGFTTIPKPTTTPIPLLLATPTEKENTEQKEQFRIRLFW